MCLIVQSVTVADVKTMSKGWEEGKAKEFAGKVCVVAQHHEQGKLRRYRLTTGKERVGGVMGGGERGVSSVKTNCPPIEWNDSEELVGVGSFVREQLNHLND